MKKYVYSYYDKNIEAYSTPVIVETNEENFVISLKRTLKTKTNEFIKAVENGLVCFKLGEFEDLTGEFTADKKLLLDCAEYITSLDHDIKEDN